MNALKVLSDTNISFYRIIDKIRLYNESCGLYVDISSVWCWCSARVVLVLSTCGADGMHHMCEGLTPLLYMEG